jgi:2-polyprenyl-3-methyl-5-hydroxy-6-metoxy-1,4-benzoquinol methylase
MDKQKIDQFWSARTQIADPRLASNYRDDGRLQIDSQFVIERISEPGRVLDLGAGGCTLANSLLPYAAEVVAVEKYGGFLEKVPDLPRLKKLQSDVVDYYDESKYEMILLFGVVNFLSDDEQSQLYSNCARMLASDGTFIVKNQCGINEEVVVDRFSDELGCDYHARYPSVQTQRDLLTQKFAVEVVDIYPEELNRWETTHFYAFVCRLNS